MQSSRRLEREAQRNVELMWLTGKLAPDHKTIANFRKDNGPAIQAACAHFIVLCRQIGLFTQALAAQSRRSTLGPDPNVPFWRKTDLAFQSARVCTDLSSVVL